MKSELYNQIQKISVELIICQELIEKDEMHLAIPSAIQIHTDSKKLVSMMWRE